MDMTRTLVVNLFGPPGAGKSTTAAGVFSILKLNGLNCELITEYAKELAWEDRLPPKPVDPYYITAKQNHRQWLVDGKVDVMITDSPLPIGIVYSQKSSEYNNHVLHLFSKYLNKNYFIERTKDYNKVGRHLDENGSNAAGVEIKQLLDENKIPYKTYQCDYKSIELISNDILGCLR